MTTEDGTITVSFNGEIYNYIEIRQELMTHGVAFRTSGDTEVLCQAYQRWGLKSLEKFNGMFAIAILDAQERKLHLIRDRFGVKPLFYHHRNGTLYFSSVARTIAKATGAEPNWDYLYQGLQQRTYEQDNEGCQYQQILAVRPGNVVTLDLENDAIARRSYFDLESQVNIRREELHGLSDRQLEEQFSYEMRRALAIRLRSDVPVGVSLSGGLDSSTVAVLASRQQAEIKCISFASAADARSEYPQIRQIQQHANLDVHYVWPSPQEFAADFWACLHEQDAPFTSLSVVAQYAVFKSARARGLKVMLGGQGGDESLMGYRKYQLPALQTFVNARQLWRSTAQTFGLCLTAVSELGNSRAYFARMQERRGSAYQWPFVYDIQRATKEIVPQHGTARPDLQILDIRNASLATLLRYEDRNSMGNSIESRLPFLDYKLVEFSVALPVHKKVAHGHGKMILRREMRDHLPHSVIWTRNKRGFYVPSERYLTIGGLGRQIRERLGAISSRLAPLLATPLNPLDFGDTALLNPGRFRTAVTLLWLAENVR